MAGKKCKYMKIDKIKLKKKLELKLGRKAKPSEIGNAHTDQNLINELLSEEIEILKKQVATLEKAKNIL